MIKHLIQALRIIAEVSVDDTNKWIDSYGKISQQALQNYVTIQNLDKADIDAVMYDLQKKGITNLKRPEQTKLNIPSGNKYDIADIYIGTITEGGSERVVIFFDFKVGKNGGLFQDQFNSHIIDWDTTETKGDVVQWAATDFDINLKKALQLNSLKET